MSKGERSGDHSGTNQPEEDLKPNRENNVYLQLKDVKEGIFSKYDWIFLNDRILFVSTNGIGTFVAKDVKANYSKCLGINAASALLHHLKDIRKKKDCVLSDQDISNILSADNKNSQLLFSEMSQVVFEKKIFRGYRLTITSKSLVRRADVPWSKVGLKNMIHFFRARIGTRFVEK